MIEGRLQIRSVNAMFCGISSFHDIAGDDPSAATIRSKKKKKQIKSKSKNKSKNKNPYSSRGLDKFTSVLSELEARREKIMASTGAQGIAMVRFMYSNSQDWIPIIVRLRDEGGNNNNNKVISTDASAVTSPKNPMEVVETTSPPQPLAAVAAVAAVSAVKRLPRLKWRPGYCMPVMMVLILVCLVIFGRVFAICCVTIWWYVMPTLEGEEGRKMRRRVSRKADYVKKMSGKRIPPPATPRAKTTGGGGVKELGSPRGDSRKKCDV